jgi:colanic acid biosynthesis glycosyl transferase WcaI
LRNWANIDEVTPLQGPSSYLEEWGITRPHVAIYSGNVANKQGIEIVVEVARLLRNRRDLMFVVCGNGPNRKKLVARSDDLDNIQFHDLQPRERLSELLGMATVHLLPQIAGAADLVLPSKLTNMLASGRAVAATAEPGTGLAIEVEGCGLVTPPGDASAFASAVEHLIDSRETRLRFGTQARRRAEERWSRDQILDRFIEQLTSLVMPDANLGSV